jgi:type III pantothenate kinase
MILLFDLGNSHLHGALTGEDGITKRLALENTPELTEADIQKSLLEFIDVESRNQISGIACSSVDAELFSKLETACKALFLHPIFVISPETVPFLEIRYENPNQLGRDRVAAAVAVTQMFPNQNVVTFDLGTATTVSLVSQRREFLGGWITPGLATEARSLHQQTG